MTRARHQAGQLSEKLRALGAEVVEIPAIEIVPPESYVEIDRALRNLSQYQWLIVTSANGAHALGGRMTFLGIEVGRVCAGKDRCGWIGDGAGAGGTGAADCGDAGGVCRGVAGGGAWGSGGWATGVAGASGGGAGCDPGCAARAWGDGRCRGCVPDSDSGGICNSGTHDLWDWRTDTGCGYVYKLIDGYEFPEFAARGGY